MNKYYKNTQGVVYAYDQEQISGGWVKDGSAQLQRMSARFVFSNE